MPIKLKTMNTAAAADRYPAFEICKDGNWIMILRDTPTFNMAAKIEFYRWLGYKVRLLDGTII